MSLRILLFLLVLLPHSGIAQETGNQQSFEALVEHAEMMTCDDGSSGCARLEMKGTSSDFKGETMIIETNPEDTLGEKPVIYKAGDRVIVQTQIIEGERQYFISDYVRRTSLVWLSILFAATVFLFGGWAAMRSFMGMIISVSILIGGILPAILAGYSPVGVALLGACVIMIITFLVCHGWNHKTLAAFCGTAGSLGVTALLAGGFAVYSHLTGTADEEVLFLLSDYPLLHTRGILLAGIIIGSLGVLDDITISQASAVFELRAANPMMSMRRLYQSALRIGSDHIAAAVNTLVLAYAGTSLPLLLLLISDQSGESWFTFINREMIAEEIVRTLTGSIGLLAAVPLTTIIACLLAKKGDTRAAHITHTHHH